ncbi:MAG: dockerin type I repeat-containing protein [Clostridia bacterium]|nr:dockerin type I repeat-containing protein [Clostridia bacterium]
MQNKHQVVGFVIAIIILTSSIFALKAGKVVGYSSFDVNIDGQVNIDDILCIRDYIFLPDPFEGLTAEETFYRCDVNGDGKVNIEDILCVVYFIFNGGPKETDIPKTISTTASTPTPTEDYSTPTPEPGPKTPWPTLPFDVKSKYYKTDVNDAFGLDFDDFRHLTIPQKTLDIARKKTMQPQWFMVRPYWQALYNFHGFPYSPRITYERVLEILAKYPSYESDYDTCNKIWEEIMIEHGSPDIIKSIGINYWEIWLDDEGTMTIEIPLRAYLISYNEYDQNYFCIYREPLWPGRWAAFPAQTYTPPPTMSLTSTPSAGS